MFAGFGTFGGRNVPPNILCSIVDNLRNLQLVPVGLGGQVLESFVQEAYGLLLNYGSGLQLTPGDLSLSLARGIGMPLESSLNNMVSSWMPGNDILSTFVRGVIRQLMVRMHPWVIQVFANRFHETIQWATAVAHSLYQRAVAATPTTVRIHIPRE